MADDREFMTEADLAPFVKSAFGAATRLDKAVRLTGGSKRGVYRLLLADGISVILYAWNEAENYWVDNSTDPRDPFAEASGLDLLQSATAALEAAGAKAPKVLLVDRTHSLYPADIALAEDVRGGTLEELIRRDPTAAAGPLRKLGSMLEAMAGYWSDKLGKVGAIEAGVAPQDRRAEQVALDQGLDNLTIVAAKVPQLGAARERIEAKLHELFAQVAPRGHYSLIHGELGADHIVLDEALEPVLVDIEGVMFFDVEWEHEFTRMRLGDRYSDLHFGLDLDPHRVSLYELVRSLSLVEGPLRILETDFPNRALMQSIHTWHTAKVLRLSGEAA